jgi:hypothetical protein
VEVTLMDTGIENSYTYDGCNTVVSLEVTKAPGFEETPMDTVFGVSYTYDACPTVVSLEVTEAPGFEETLMDTVFGDSYSSIRTKLAPQWSRWKSLIHPRLKHSKLLP